MSASLCAGLLRPIKWAGVGPTDCIPRRQLLLGPYDRADRDVHFCLKTWPGQWAAVARALEPGKTQPPAVFWGRPTWQVWDPTLSSLSA